MKKLLVLALALVVMIGSLLAGALFVGGAQPPEDECGGGDEAVAVSVANLPKAVGPFSGEQLENAALIINAGKKLGIPRRGQTIAVMTAIAESTLRNLDRGDSVGPDSRGLFQQRAGGAWGSLEDRMDPTTASTNFYKARQKVEGWEAMAPSLAAHEVQANADPYGYAKHWSSATDLVAALERATVTTGKQPASAMSPKTAIAKYHLGPVKEVTAQAVAFLAPMFKIDTVGGWRPVDAFPDHPSGHAADFMVGTSPSGRTKGDRLAAYVQKHHKELGVDYVIWYQRIWSPARNGEGWRPMDDRGSPTANHMDHVHITFKGDASDGELPAVTGGCEPGDGGGEAVAGDGERVKPAEGPITSPFGLRAHPTRGGTRMHEGIDIGAPCEAPIKATSSGRVIYAGPMSGYGHMIEIDHGKGTTSRYGHMYANGLLTRVGARVKTGQRIASVGSDGASTGCHLHFEIRVKDQPTDPQAWLSGGKRTT